MKSMISSFLRLESASGLLLIGAAALALILNNSPLSWLYDGLLEVPMSVQVGALVLDKPLLLWINDGLMAVFFCSCSLVCGLLGYLVMRFAPGSLSVRAVSSRSCGFAKIVSKTVLIEWTRAPYYLRAGAPPSDFAGPAAWSERGVARLAMPSRRRPSTSAPVTMRRASAVQ